jgi:hypothetical protein
MPLDLLLQSAGDYERTHQTVLYVLFQNGLAQHLGLAPARKVEWEYRKSLFDLALEHAGGAETGLEIKTWSELTKEQLERQRRWAAQSNGRLVYILMGFSEYEGLPGRVGAAEVVAGVPRLAEAVEHLMRGTPHANVRGLAEAYLRWLRAHDDSRRRGMDEKTWTRAQWAIFYANVRGAQDREVSIYKVENPSGGIHVLNFSESWTPLDDQRLPGAEVFWELVNGTPTFKFGPTGKEAAREVKRAVRSELRGLVLAASQERGLDFKPFGRLGEHMGIAQASVNLRTFWRDGALDVAQCRRVLDVCWAVFSDVLNAWRRRSY